MADAKNKEVPAEAAASNEDQSMEEILQSIRKIIAEEGDGAEMPAADTDDIDADDDGVLELTDVVQDDGSVVNVDDGDSDILDEIDDALTEEASPEPEPQPVPEPAAPQAAPAPQPKAAPRPAPAPVQADDGEGIVSSASIAAASAALQGLKHPGDLGAMPFMSGNTVESLVQQLLRPMLKDWLDANLPSIVQQAVEQEVRRISQK